MSGILQTVNAVMFDDEAADKLINGVRDAESLQGATDVINQALPIPDYETVKAYTIRTIN